MHMPRFVYPVFYQWTLELFSPLAVVNDAAMNISILSVQVPLSVFAVT